MAGGAGSRLDATVEKPLCPVAGAPMIERVLDALAASRTDRTFAVTSPATPETAATLGCPCIETSGDGYVADLDRALADERVSMPALTVAADLPLLDGDAVDIVLDAADGALTVALPVGRKRALGLSVDTAFRHGSCLVTPAGVNVVGEGEGTLLTRDLRFAANVNRSSDARRVEWLLSDK